MTIVSATHLSKSYSLLSQNDTKVLRDVSVDIAQGEFVAVVGPSGAGKSTLLHILGTLDTPDEGRVSVTFNGHHHDLGSMSASDMASLRNKHIGFIFQFHQLLPEFSALENVMMPTLISGESMKSASTKAKNLLETVGLSHRLEHKPSELSGGEQQRVAIARALMNEPEILYADEPTGNLDSANTVGILQLLSDIRSQRKLTMLIATHSPDIATSAQRIIHMRDGAIVGTIESGS